MGRASCVGLALGLPDAIPNTPNELFDDGLTTACVQFLVAAAAMLFSVLVHFPAPELEHFLEPEPPEPVLEH